MTSPERVLIVGSGAREHALAWRLGRDVQAVGVRAVHVAPGNDGMRDVATIHPEVSTSDLDAVVTLADSIGADLVVVGPEAPLAAGLADRLSHAGIAVFGPTRAAARLESSKRFCRSIAEAAGIPMAEGASFDRSDEAIAFARRLAGAVAVKADGLAAGKGVSLCQATEEAEAAIRAALDERVFGEAGSHVVVERQLAGREASLLAICDGTRAIALPPARDHKRVGDGDSGPNTGGMGAYSPLADLDEADADGLLDVFHRPALAELARRGTPFRGVLYAGLMLTEDGPYLLEFNVRFGDPEAQAVLPRVGGRLGAILLAGSRGTLDSLDDASMTARAREGAESRTGTDGREATVAVVLAAAGYPATPRTGDPIDGLAAARAAGALVFHGATGTRHGWPVTAGGRVVTVVGRGKDVAEAHERAYTAVQLVRFAGMHYRQDIGAPAPLPTPALVGAAR
jgi:phosphoribosylamine--glycine ligase